MSERSGPLRGIRVLDFSIALTGPYAAALMADQGADVVKVERPGIGDLRIRDRLHEVAEERPLHLVRRSAEQDRRVE